MSDARKYYYLKLKEDFFKRDEIEILEAMDGGYKYSNILLKLYLKSLKDDGRLMMNGRIPYNAKMIATVTGHDIDTVERALRIFKELELIEMLETGAIYMLDIQNFIGQSSNEGDRKRAMRARLSKEQQKQKLGPGQTSGQTSAKRPQETEKEIEKKIEINSEIVRKFSAGFQKRFGYELTEQDEKALVNCLNSYRYKSRIEREYYNAEIFLRTVLKRMEDRNTGGSKMQYPIKVFFAGTFGKDPFLWRLTPAEEMAGGGYQKPLIAKIERRGYGNNQDRS